MSVLIFLIFGAIFAMLGVYMIIQSINQKKRCTQVVVGKIVEIETEERHERIDDTRYEADGSFTRTIGPARYRTTVSHYPIYQYSVDGKEYISKAKSASSLGNLMIGKEENIYYNPENPQDSYAEGEPGKSIVGGVIMIIVGIVAAVMGTVVGNSQIQ